MWGEVLRGWQYDGDQGRRRHARRRCNDVADDDGGWDAKRHSDEGTQELRCYTFMGRDAHRYRIVLCENQTPIKCRRVFSRSASCLQLTRLPFVVALPCPPLPPAVSTSILPLALHSQTLGEYALRFHCFLPPASSASWTPRRRRHRPVSPRAPTTQATLEETTTTAHALSDTLRLSPWPHMLGLLRRVLCNLPRLTSRALATHPLSPPLPPCPLSSVQKSRYYRQFTHTALFLLQTVATTKSHDGRSCA